jgi:cellulose synthase operon protein C
MGTSKVIGIPEREGDFERHCRVLFAEIVADPNLKPVATRGKNQGGFDLIGKRNGDPDKPVGIQCKNKPKGGKLDLDEVRSDIARMLAFEPPVTEIYVATTASDDHEYDKAALALCKAQKDAGRTVDIQIWGWDTLTDRILRSALALSAFDPDYSASTNTLLERSHESLELHRDAMAIQRETLSLVTEVRAFQLSADTSEAGTRAAVDEVLHKQIDDVRDLMNNGQARTALGLLEKLKTAPGATVPSIQSRIIANIGHAIMRLGDEQRGGSLLLEAYEINPDDAKLRANRVLGLLLTGMAREAVDFGTKLFANGLGDTLVASFLYQAAAFLDDDVSPEVVVGHYFDADENVAIGRLVYLRKHRPAAEWRQAAREAVQSHPESSIIARLSAEAVLDDIFERRAFGPGDVDQRDRDAATNAILTLRTLWDAARTQEDASHQQIIGIVVNLITAYRATRDPQAADEVGRQALALAPNDEALLIATAHIDTILDRTEAAIEKLTRVPESHQRTIALIGAYASLERWEEVADFATPERRTQLDGFDQQAFDCMTLDARLRAGRVFEIAPALNALIDMWPDELHVLASAADMARTHSAENFNELFERARVLARCGDPTLGERLVLADLALRVERFDVAIETLDGHVDIQKPSEPLTWLAMAHVNSSDATAAHRFFEGLPDAVLTEPRYARMAGVAEYNRGDLKSAERHLQHVLGVETDDLRSRLMLEGAYLRDGHDGKAKDLISAVDEKTAKGSAIEKMRLAVALRRAGEQARAFHLAFEVASQNRDIEDVASAYTQLLLMFDAAIPEAALPNGIQNGVWFRLEGQGTSDIEGMVSDEAIPEAHVHAADQPIGQAVIGKKVGDEVTLPPRLGIELRYIVREIKHKWIWLAHDIMRSHSARFPDSASMVEMTMQDNDVRPVLDIVRKSENQVLSDIESYCTTALPLSFVAAMRGGDVVGFSHRVSASGGEIKTCTGFHMERWRAQRVVRRASGRGAVLDTYTLVVAESFNLLPALRDYFGHVLVSRDTADAFAEWRQRQTFNLGRETMSLGYDGDQAVRYVQTPVDNAQQLQNLDRLIANMREYCEVMPLEGGNEPETETIGQMGLGDLLEPIRLARRHNMPLLSDDLHYRQLAALLGVPRSVWLQAVGLDLLDQSLMTRHDYAVLAARLAHKRHSFVTTDAETLLELLGLENDEEDYAFKILASNVGGQNADLRSHCEVVIGFAARVWLSPCAGWRQGRAIGRLLENLLKGRGENAGVLLDFIDDRLARHRANLNERSDLAREYLRGWRCGHFIDAQSGRSGKFRQQTGKKRAGRKATS